MMGHQRSSAMAMAMAVAPLAFANTTRIRVFALAWREDAAIVVRQPSGWGSAHETLRELRLAKERGAGDAGVLRRWKRLNRGLRHRVLEQIMEQADWELALTVYMSMKDESWCKDNMIVHAQLAGLLAKVKGQEHADLFILDYSKQLSKAEKVKLGCTLIEWYAKYNLWELALTAFAELQTLGLSSATACGYKSLLQAQATMGDPFEAEVTLTRMKTEGIRPSAENYKALLFSFGKSGLLTEMQGVLEQMKEGGYQVDTVTCNMMLVAYGMHRNYDQMQDVLGMMQDAKLKLSVRSWNALTNACPILTSLALSNESDMILSCESLCSKLTGTGEVVLVEAMMGLKLPSESVKWSQQCWKLNMHGMTVGTAYVVLLCWLKEVRRRFCVNGDIPKEIEVVTGWGRHSHVEGTSQVKVAVAGCLRSIKSPFKVDSQNKGTLVGRGHKVKEWLLGACQEKLQVTATIG